MNTSTFKITCGMLLLFPLLALGLLFVLMRYLTCIFTNQEKAWHIAVLIDEAANVSANGAVNMTISARAALAAQKNETWGCVLCKILGWIQTNHCQNSLSGIGGIKKDP